MRVGWEVFHGRGREARDLIRQHVAALEAEHEAREAELDKKNQREHASKGEPLHWTTRLCRRKGRNRNG